MAGLIAFTEAFKANTAEMHLKSPSGELPMYLIKDSKGVLSVATGTWEKLEAADLMDLDAAEVLANRAAIPPSVPKGSVAEPIVLTIRNGGSPDAIKFCKDHNLDPKEEANEKSKNRNKKISKEDKVAIMTAALIVDWKNVPCEGDDNTELMKFNAENAIQLLKDLDGLFEQVQDFVRSRKKFEPK